MDSLIKNIYMKKNARKIPPPPPGTVLYRNGKQIGVQPEPAATEATVKEKPVRIPKQKPEKELPSEPIKQILPTKEQMAYQSTAEKQSQTDLFGEVIVEDVLLRDKFIEPPFSVLDTKGGNWKNRTRRWKSIGIKSELGRGEDTLGFNGFGDGRNSKKATKKANAKTFNMSAWLKEKPTDGAQTMSDTSIFDPTLCELLYHWFCPVGGRILDSFAGGSVRGIVANYLGYKYTGIDIRQEQIESNRAQAIEILPVNNQPQWYVGDSNVVLDELYYGIKNGSSGCHDYDFLMSCPPYADLEVYSDLPGDISNKPYKEFMEIYRSIIRKSCDLLKSGSYAAWTVGEVRNKKGNYIGFVPDTIRAFTDCGMFYYNEAILLNSIASASLRADGNMKYQKLVKCHQNVLVFKKP